MKIAVVAIGLNKAQFIERWVFSAFDADYIILGDFGSTDGTQEIFEDLAKEYDEEGSKFILHSLMVKPWRFDVARNSLHSLIPVDVDYVINLNLDEVLIGNWREAFNQMSSEVTRPSYTFTSTKFADGTPGLEKYANKICSRNGYFWERFTNALLPHNEQSEIRREIYLEVRHVPEINKTINEYLEETVLQELNTLIEYHTIGVPGSVAIINDGYYTVSKIRESFPEFNILFLKDSLEDFDQQDFQVVIFNGFSSLDRFDSILAVNKAKELSKVVIINLELDVETWSYSLAMSSFGTPTGFEKLEGNSGVFAYYQ